MTNVLFLSLVISDQTPRPLYPPAQAVFRLLVELTSSYMTLTNDEGDG